MRAAAEPVDPGRSSWVPVRPGSGFPLQNLPYGIFSRPGDAPRAGVAIGDEILDLAAVQAAGLLDGDAELPEGLFARPRLNDFLALGRPAWRALRRRLLALLDAGDRSLREHPFLPGAGLVPQAGARLHLPVAIGDYVDFYASLEHAVNLGRLLRPGEEPLLPNWRHLPVGYHGRAGTVVVSGTPIRRPRGQLPPAEPGGPPCLVPTEQLDVEVELGFLTGPGSALGRPIAIGEAAEHIFGFVLVNDWSARDIQRWEYRPLGPFLGKSFATSISPWVVTLDALAPFRTGGPAQDPPVLSYLRTEQLWHVDVALELRLAPAGAAPATIARTNARHLYWSPAQMLAHATSGGASTRPGDLFASGTISGPEPESRGSLIELTWGGRDPLVLPDGSRRVFLEDGDEVTIMGAAARGGPAPLTIGLGEVRGRVEPPPDG